MAQKPAGQSITDKIKSAFGLPSQTSPRPVKVPDHAPIQRQDSFPEICGTPSEVGLFEVAHNKDLHDEKGNFSWRKFFFEAPGSSPAKNNAGGSGASSQ